MTGAPSTNSPPLLRGEVVYMYAFDVAYEMIRKPVPSLLGQPVAQFAVDASKRSPRQLFFYRPQMVRLPAVEKFGPLGPVRLERTVKLLPVGAISITVRVPFEVAQVEDLVPLHDLRFNDGSYLYDEVRDLADQVRNELKSFYIQPVEKLGDEEAYTVFCLNAPPAVNGQPAAGAEDWLREHRRSVSALLTEETDPGRLSEQESEETSSRALSYYESDVVVIDWDAALIIDEPRYFDEVLFIMELANVQLAELEAYDRILDDAVERSYRDVSIRRWRGLAAQHELREIRIDMARLSDELSNTTKFFGDWHLARIYQNLSARFHLADWHRAIDEKLKTLDDMYQLLRHDQNNRWMFLLEFMVVLLFVLEIAKSFWGK
jgi:hypothetical protein